MYHGLGQDHNRPSGFHEICWSFWALSWLRERALDGAPLHFRLKSEMAGAFRFAGVLGTRIAGKPEVYEYLMVNRAVLNPKCRFEYPGEAHCIRHATKSGGGLSGRSRPSHLSETLIESRNVLKITN